MERVEEAWRDVAPEMADSPQQPDSVLDTGREAYLRTKQALDEASAVSSMLFLGDGVSSMSRRYEEKADGGEDGLDASGAGGSSWAGTGNRGGVGVSASSFGKNSLFFPARAAGGGGGGGGDDERGSEWMAGGILAAAATRAVPSGRGDIRPEEEQFCDAFLELQSVLGQLQPGARVQAEQIFPILRKMHSFSRTAEGKASDLASRLRELRGSGSPAVAVAAATAHELSLEKDTWSLLRFLNHADKEDAEIKNKMRQHEEDADGHGDAGPPPYAPPDPNEPDEVVIAHMRARDSGFRRTEAVVEWLQGAMYDRVKDRDLGGRGGVHFGWSNTLESLSLGGGQKSDVGQMHPDANLRKISRGGRGAGAGMKVLRLAGQDDLDEEELMRNAWKWVRAGKLSRALKLCERWGQPWRAAAMSGGGVVGTHKMGVMEDGDEEDLESIENGYAAAYSPGQGLWQEMCWQLSVSLGRGADSSEGPARSVAKHEAALFAHLSGNSGLLLDSDLTQSWEDQAWVRFTALLHVKVLEERIRHRQAQAEMSALYPGVGTLGTDERLKEQMMASAPPMSHSSIFEVLDDDSRGRVRAEGKGVYRQAQQALVLGGENIELFLQNILWRVAAASGADEEVATAHVDGDGAATSPEVFRSPQLLRFAAHLALVLAAQYPDLTTREEETIEAIEDVVYAYTQHLVKTHQVGLVAIYAATLPTRRRRELYAAFLRSVEGDGNRRVALEQANSHMPGDVPAILKKVVEDVRLQTVSVTPPMPKQVPEGDLKKINAMSWLLDHPDTQAEAAVQANALARHLVLQKYQQSVIGGHGHCSSSFGRGGGLPWGAPAAQDDASYDEVKTPTVLSARLDAVKMLLQKVSSQGGGGLDEGAVLVGDDSDRERECWALLLGAREAYTEWSKVERAGEGKQEEDGEEEGGVEALRDAAEAAMQALELVLTFEDGWMYPIAKDEEAVAATPSAAAAQTARQASNAEASSMGSWELVDADADVEADAAANQAGGGMVVPFPGGSGMDEEEGQSVWARGDDIEASEEENRKAKEVADVRRRREREEAESVKGMEEAARRAGEAAREEEMLRVREACLPGLVFLAHGVAHKTGLRMLGEGFVDAAQGWFARVQKLATTIVKDKYRTLLAMKPGQMERFLQCVERSTTKLLECNEPRA